MPHNTTTEEQQPTATLQHVDPGTLLVDLNIRRDLRLDADFLASIKEQGVLVPIVAVKTLDGLRVRHGHRRTHAATAAGLTTVPVYVLPSEGADDKATEIERLITQHAENEHRSGLSNSERADVATQLAAFGVSAAQISKRTRMARTDVDAALALTNSKLATAAVERYDFLDLIQAAVIAEFEDEPETVKALVAAAQSGRFEHVAQVARDRRADADARRAATSSLQDSGMTVVEQPPFGSKIKELNALTDDTENREPLTREAHEHCPGHAAYLAEKWSDEVDDEAADDTDEEKAEPTRQLVPVYVCTEPAQNGHESRWGRMFTDTPKGEMSEAAKEAEREARREVIANNKAWRSAEEVRRQWLRALLGRKTPPKGSVAFIAEALLRSEYDGAKRDTQLAADLLGIDAGSDACTGLLDALAVANDGRGQVISLGLVLSGYEAFTGVHSWRNHFTGTARYLLFLEQQGYVLSHIEVIACGTKTHSPTPEQVGD